MESPTGRPPIPADLQRLIVTMARANPTWGEERIANELLLKLGLAVSPRARPADRFSIFLFSCTPKMLPSGEGGIEAIGARWTPAGPAARSWTEQLASGHFFTGK